MSLSGAALLWCFIQTVIVISSLYVFVPSAIRSTSRDDPLHIQYRLIAFYIATLLCFLGTRWFISQQDFFFLNSITLTSTCLPLIAFVCLFAGHWIQLFLLPPPQSINISNEFWVNFRNLCFAPVPEEIIFRGFMGAALKHAQFSTKFLLFGTPLFFGLAHVHLGVMRWLQEEEDVQTIVFSTLFQVAYTTLFGALMMDVLLKTENIFAVIIIHCFCNIMGFPNFFFWQRADVTSNRKWIVGLTYTIGIFLFLNIPY